MSATLQAEQHVPINRLTWVRFLGVVRDFVSSEVRWKARSLFTLLLAFLFGINGLNVVNSYVARDFMTAIEHRDRAAFIWQATIYVVVFAASTLVAVLYRFSEERLALLWRTWLTRGLLTRYLAQRAGAVLKDTTEKGTTEAQSAHVFFCVRSTTGFTAPTMAKAVRRRWRGLAPPGEPW